MIELGSITWKLNFPTLVIIFLGVIGISAAIMAFFMTPPEKRFRYKPRTLEERRAACSPDAQAVIIKGDWRKALKREAWWLPALLPLIALAVWTKLTDGESCAMLFGFSRSSIAIFFIAFGTPLMVLAAFFTAIKNGISLIRGGYWPPLDTVPFVDTLAKKGRWVRLQGWYLCLIPFVMTALLVYSFVSFNELMGEYTFWSLIEKIEADCRTPH